MSDYISRQAILKNIEKVRQDALMMDDTRKASIIMNGMHLCEKTVRNQPSAQPESTIGQLNTDAISRQAAIDALAKFVPYAIDDDATRAYTDGLTDAYNMICQLPSVQPTLFGYKIEHLAYIAMVMEKEGVTAEYAVRTFGDISRAVRMIIEEAQQKAEEMLNEQFNQQIGNH